MFKIKKYTTVVGLLIILTLLLCAGVVVFAKSGFRLPADFSTFGRNTTHQAVFERNGEIYLYDGQKNTIKTLTSGGKYSPLVSPDNTKILYRKAVYETPNNALIFGVIDISGKEICEITIDTPFSNEIIGMNWVTNSQVAVTTHVNPSTSEYFLYDIIEEKLISRANGGSFAVIPGTDKVIHEKNIPHWSNESVYHSFQIGEEIVYTSNTLDTKLGTPIFSDDLSKMAFVETTKNDDTYENSNSTHLIICDIDLRSLELTQKTKVAIDSNIVGHLTFSDNVVCFVNSDLVYWYDEVSGIFVEENIETNLRNASTDSERMKDLQQAVIDRWNDGSLNSVNSVNWLSE